MNTYLISSTSMYGTTVLQVSDFFLAWNLHFHPGN